MTTNKHDLDELIVQLMEWGYDQGEFMIDREAEAKSNIISLIESIGLEAIGADEDYHKHKTDDEKVNGVVRNTLKATQREKLNTIIKRLR